MQAVPQSRAFYDKLIKVLYETDQTSFGSEEQQWNSTDPFKMSAALSSLSPMKDLNFIREPARISTQRAHSYQQALSIQVDLNRKSYLSQQTDKFRSYFSETN